MLAHNPISSPRQVLLINNINVFVCAGFCLASWPWVVLLLLFFFVLTEQVFTFKLDTVRSFLKLTSVLMLRDQPLGDLKLT